LTGSQGTERSMTGTPRGACRGKLYRASATRIALGIHARRDILKGVSSPVSLKR
jgi:hypothetical protein